MELPRRFPPGSEITCQLIEAILQEQWRWRRADGSPPIDLLNADGTDPPIFSFGGIFPITIKMGFTTGGATARSGTSPGTGSFNPVTYDGTNLNTDNTQSFGFLSLSATAVGTNKYIICIKIADQWWIIFEDCG